MKFLITTEPDDVYAMVVKLALENSGHSARLLCLARQFTKQNNSVFIDNDFYHLKQFDGQDDSLDQGYDIVWDQRPPKPIISGEKIHPDDYLFVLRENTAFYESLAYNLAPKAWWINSKESARKSHSKLLQLKMANEQGMTIPLTLFSNNPIDIRTFLLNHEKEGVVYKPLYNNCWVEKKQTKIASTAKINFLDLPNNKFLQMVPGIFQKEIKKQYELRVICFGDYLVTAKLTIQHQATDSIDGHISPKEEWTIEAYSLPAELEGKIRQFRRKMGVVLATFDFIVTPDNQYFFTEMDEQGQFWWIEEANPAFKMLDIFVQFLLNKSTDFIWTPDKESHALKFYRDKMRQPLMRSSNRHLG